MRKEMNLTLTTGTQMVQAQSNELSLEELDAVAGGGLFSSLVRTIAKKVFHRDLPKSVEKVLNVGEHIAGIACPALGMVAMPAEFRDLVMDYKKGKITEKEYKNKLNSLVASHIIPGSALIDDFF